MDIFRLLARGSSIKQKQKDELRKFRGLDTKPEPLDDHVNFFTPRTKLKKETPEPRVQESQKERTVKPEITNLGKVTVTGDAPEPISTFEELVPRYNLADNLLRNIQRIGFDIPTEVQREALPALIDGHDVVACAPTGSGKTLAFLIPVIHALTSQEAPTTRLRGVVVSPTRELAAQIYEVAVRLTLPGKQITVTNLTKAQLAKIRNNNAGRKHTMDLIISTPLRLLEAVKEGLVVLSGVRWLVLDEADRLLGDGFVEQTDEIVQNCTNSSVVKAIFSATMPSNVEELAKSIMTASVVRIIVGRKEAASTTIDQKLLFCGTEHGKLTAIRQMLSGGEITPPILIFVQSIQRAKALVHELLYDKVNVDVIHSELSQRQRDHVINNFKQGHIWVLICTDVLSRGIDFSGVNMVINYDIPLSSQSYVHRIGRTGRAGRTGKAVTFYTKEDAPNLLGILNVMQQSGFKVDEWLRKAAGRSKYDRPIRREAISTVPAAVKRQKRRRREMIESRKRSG